MSDDVLLYETLGVPHDASPCEIARAFYRKVNENTNDNMHELMMVHEAEHLLQSCMLSTLSTLQRKESGRSVYRRADYPEKSAAYDGRILVVNRKKGRPETFWR